MLKGKTVVLGVTGSIAAYKMANLASMLVKKGCSVHVIMTRNATNFINPITFETLTGHKCLVDTFDRNFEFSVEHVSAMNTNMFENPIVQDNLTKLKSYGYEIVEPASGYLACGVTGKGKMPEPEVLYSYILKTIGCEKDLLGKKVLITAGPTLEKIDPVRFISNHSTGKMGYAIAENAMLRGAEVTLVTGRTSIKKPDFVKIIDVLSAQDMFEAVDENFDQQDIVIMSAAVADYRPKTVATEKIKKKDGEESIQLERTTDILGTMSKRKKNQFVCGFSMETENMLENSKAKLEKKNLDMICANNLKVKGAGFGTDTNVVTLITKDNVVELPLESKAEVAAQILDTIVKK